MMLAGGGASSRPRRAAAAGDAHAGPPRRVAADLRRGRLRTQPRGVRGHPPVPEGARPGQLPQQLPRLAPLALTGLQRRCSAVSPKLADSCLATDQFGSRRLALRVDARSLPPRSRRSARRASSAGGWSSPSSSCVACAPDRLLPRVLGRRAAQPAEHGRERPRGRSRRAPTGLHSRSATPPAGSAGSPTTKADNKKLRKENDELTVAILQLHAVSRRTRPDRGCSLPGGPSVPKDYNRRCRPRSSRSRRSSSTRACRRRRRPEQRRPSRRSRSSRRRLSRRQSRRV